MNFSSSFNPSSLDCHFDIIFPHVSATFQFRRYKSSSFILNLWLSSSWSNSNRHSMEGCFQQELKKQSFCIMKIDLSLQLTSIVLSMSVSSSCLLHLQVCSTISMAWLQVNTVGLSSQKRRALWVSLNLTSSSASLTASFTVRLLSTREHPSILSSVISWLQDMNDRINTALSNFFIRPSVFPSSPNVRRRVWRKVYATRMGLANVSGSRFSCLPGFLWLDIDRPSFSKMAVSLSNEGRHNSTQSAMSADKRLVSKRSQWNSSQKRSLFFAAVPERQSPRNTLATWFVPDRHFDKMPSFKWLNTALSFSKSPCRAPSLCQPLTNNSLVFKTSCISMLIPWRSILSLANSSLWVLFMSPWYEAIRQPITSGKRGEGALAMMLVRIGSSSKKSCIVGNCSAAARQTLKNKGRYFSFTKVARNW